MDLLCFFSKH